MGVEVGAKTLLLVPVLALGQECWRLQACADLGPSPVVLSMCECVCVYVCVSVCVCVYEGDAGSGWAQRRVRARGIIKT